MLTLYRQNGVFIIYITGDIHGNPWAVFKFARRNKLTKDDIIIIPGDAGANYYGNERDDGMKDLLTSYAKIL